MIVSILLILTFAICKAPEWKSLYIMRAEPIQKYEPLVRAVYWVESKHGKYLWNPKELAVGPFQIRPCRVDDYNRRTGSHYKHEDFYDYELSRKMFLYFAQNKSFEQAAKDWNGSGPMTIEYWKQVKAVLKL